MTRVTPNSPRTRDIRPKPASVVRMGIAAIETRDHTQIKQDPPSMFLYSQGCLVKPVAHQDARLNPPTAVWWSPGCPPPGLHSNGGLRAGFAGAHPKHRQEACGTVPHSNALRIIIVRQILTRSPLFEWNPRPDIASSGRHWRCLA